MTPQLAEGPPSSRSTGALLLGVLALLVCGFFAGIPAAVLGKRELIAIDEGRSPESGRARATIGYGLGLAATVLWCLGTGIYVVILAIAAAR